MTEHTSRNSITVSQDEVSFNVLKPSVNMGGVPANGTYSDANGQAAAGSGINVVDIDWNEAQLGAAILALGEEVPDNGVFNSTTITTTGELIQIIAKQQKQIDALIVMMKALYGTFTTD